MRRVSLAPPRPIPRLAETAPVDWPAFVAGTASGREAGLIRGRLAHPVFARERRRPLFHPESGWFRSLERRFSHYLSRAVYPRIPGMAWPYARQLSLSLTLAECEIALDGLAPEFDGCRVLLITDIHAGPFVDPTRLAATLRRLISLDPDLVLLGGDLITSGLGEFERNATAFKTLRAPLGVFAVLGNHDHYCEDPARLVTLIERAGVTPLVNRSVVVRRAGGALTLGGIDDLLMGRPDLSAALAGARPPVVLLSHNPDILFEAARSGVALVLAGHTHGGQIRLPGLPVLVRQSLYRLDCGRYRHGDTELVVSRGLGAVGIPWRVGCPPEAVLLTLRGR